MLASKDENVINSIEYLLDNPQSMKKKPDPNHYGTQHLGIFNNYKLSDLVNHQTDGFIDGRIVRLAYVSNNSIHIDEDAINLFQRYAKFQIAFVSILGQSKAGKSFFLDKILNLAEFNGVHYSNDEQKHEGESGLHIWSIPFTKDNLKIFLIDWDDVSKQTKESQDMLLDLMLLLSSSVMIIQSNQDKNFQKLSQINQSIKNSMARIISNDKPTSSNSKYWPHNVYCLYRQPNKVTKDLEIISQLFYQFNFSIIHDAIDPKKDQRFTNVDLLHTSLIKYESNQRKLNESYIKQVSMIFKDIYSKIFCKQYMNVRYLGANLQKVILNAGQSLNMNNQMNVDKIFQKTLKQLYTQAYNYHISMYDENLQSHLLSEDPYPLDYLLKAFQDSSDKVYKSYDNRNANLELKASFGQRLEKYIEEKERIVLEINKKKTSNRLKSSFPVSNINANMGSEDALQIIQKLKTIEPELDHDRVKSIQPKLMYCQQKLGAVNQDNQKFQFIQSQILIKNTQLKRVKDLNYQSKLSMGQISSKQKTMEDQLRKLNDRAFLLKTEIASNSRSRDDHWQTGNADQLQNLNKTHMKMVSMINENDKIINDLKRMNAMNPVDQDDQIQMLKTQIDHKISQQKQALLSSSSISQSTNHKKVQRREVSGNSIKVISSSIKH